MFEYSPPLEPWLDILFKDKDIMVVNKPTGLLSVPGRGPENEDSVLHRVKQQHPKAAAAHRLDMSTTGVIVIPLNPNSHRELSRQFRERETEKHYLAWVWGEPEAESGQVDLPLCVDWPNRPKQKVDHEEGRHALTLWEKLKVENGNSLIKLTPITGRSHQLRVHMLELGHPILGDNLYAHPDALAAAPHLYLHAAMLTISHPRSGEADDLRGAGSFPGLIPQIAEIKKPPSRDGGFFIRVRREYRSCFPEKRWPMSVQPALIALRFAAASAQLRPLGSAVSWPDWPSSEQNQTTHLQNLIYP